MAVTTEQVSQLVKYFERLADDASTYASGSQWLSCDCRKPDYAYVFRYVALVLEHLDEGDEAGIHDAKDSLNDCVLTVEEN